MILHPNYNTSTFDYDVAVLCTETPFTAGVNAQVVEIAATAPLAGTRGVSTGWGRIHADPHVNMPLYLQRAGDLAVLDEAECQRHSPEVTITGRMLCAFSSEQAICTVGQGLVRLFVLSVLFCFGFKMAISTHPLIHPP